MPTKYYGPSYVAHIGYRLSPELRLGVSYNVGPYSQPKINSTLPDGKNISDFVQEIWGFEATYTRGRTEIKAELFHDRWEVPNVQEDPVDISYYSEIKHKLMAGFYGALRYNAIHFNKIAKSNGVREQWDYDVKRWQIASGYSFNKKMEIRMEYMWNMTDASADPEDNLFSIQWIRSF
jgi:predicted porin